jgi:hypothetical protein
VREGIDSFIGLWNAAVDSGAVGLEDDLEDALRKVDAAGGLYAASGSARSV